MPSLEQILVGHDWVAKSKLRSALQNRKRMGGRLDTCLLEINALPEERLLQALSEHYQVPYAEIEALREVPEETRDVLEARLARRCKAVPFYMTTTALHLAVLDPNDLACQDEVAFATGKRIHVHVTTEVRIYEALTRYYGQETPSRQAALLDRLNRERYLWKEAEERAAEVGEPAAPPSGLPGLPDPLAELFPEPAAAPSPSPPTAPPPPPTSIKLSLEEKRSLYPGKPAEAFAATGERLAAAEERDEVGQALLELLETLFDRSALFVVRKGKVEGWRMQAKSFDAACFQRLSIPFDTPSVFLNLKAGSPFHLGPLADIPAHRSLAGCWGGELPAGCLLVPVRLRERLVLVLYGDPGEEPLGALPLHRFQALARSAAEALERCIVLKKKRASGSSGG